MIESSLGLIVEGLVSTLLVATIFYCISVNRKLERLRSEQQGMHSFIKELSSATLNADKAIQSLRATVQDSGAELAGQIDKGRNMSRRLKGEIESAEQTMNKLIVLTGAAGNSSGTREAAKVALQGAETSNKVNDLRRSMLGFEDLEPGAPSKDPTAADFLVANGRETIR